METLSSATTSPGMRNMQLVQDECQFQIVPGAICFVIFGTLINFLCSLISHTDSKHAPNTSRT